MLVYFMAAPKVYDLFFVLSGQPVQLNAHVPDATEQAKSWVDGLDLYTEEVRGVYELWGWAFPITGNAASFAEYERWIVLVGPRGNRVFAAEPRLRKSVHEAFGNSGLDVRMSGFSTLIARSSLPLGSYGIGVLFKHPNGALYYVETGRCITHTSNSLSLEEPSSSRCGVR